MSLFHQVSLDGNVSTSTLQFTPLRQDNGKSLVCRASNELVKRSTKEITMKLNVCCKFEQPVIINYVNI